MNIKLVILGASLLAGASVMVLASKVAQPNDEGSYPEAVAQAFVSSICEGKLREAETLSLLTAQQIQSLVDERPLRVPVDLQIVDSRWTPGELRLRVVVHPLHAPAQNDTLAIVILKGPENASRVASMRWGAK